MVFTYEEIFSSTDGFSDSRLLGHGTYGSVYYGLLHEQVWSSLLLFASLIFFFSFSIKSRSHTYVAILIWIEFSPGSCY